jgi:PAS domain S-box-containing protein
MSRIAVPTPLPPSRKSAGHSAAPAAAARTRPSSPRATARETGSAQSLRGELQARTDELAASLAITRATLESTADGILVTDHGGRVTAWNEKFLQIWGFTRDDVQGATHAQLLQSARSRLAQPAATAQRVAAIHAAPRDHETMDQIDLCDGRVLERFSCVQRLAGRGVGRVWSYRDISARVQAEDALRDEAGVLHFLNRTGATIAATLDVATLLQTVIDAATQASGAAFGAFYYRDDEAAPDAVPAPRPGRPMLALAGVAHAAAIDPTATVARFVAAWSGERTVRCADVTALDCPATQSAWSGLAEGWAPLRSLLAVPVTLRSGKAVAGLVFGHPDVGVFIERTERIVAGLAAHAAVALDNARLIEGTRRVALEREQLAEAERRARADAVSAAHLKDEFLSTLSHELRTPLTAILGWANVLLLKRSEPATQQRGLEAIARNAGAQAALIDELLDMSRIVSGKVQLEMQAADLSRIVDAAIASVKAPAAARRIDLVRHIDRSACRVRGDPARLQQVVENLLSNAVKFTPERGRVQIGVAAVDGHVELAVEDTGAGIDPQFVPHVFDPFRQADSSTTRRHGGLGLGLAIVKQLVSMHGGAVSARSAGPGLGACFVVRLPCNGKTAVDDVATAADAAPVAFADVDLHGLQLLVVDDDTDARELIAQVLVECGAQVRQAANAADALDEFERERPDVLLSDIGMPERDGYELIREIRSLDAAHGGEVPAVAITAFTRPEDRAQAMLAGYQAHVAKPVLADELVAAIAGLALGRRAA